MTTAYDTRLTTALEYMRQYLGDVNVRPADDIPAEQCNWCGSVDAMTQVRVTAIPNPDATTEDGERVCCHRCTPDVVAWAQEIHDPRTRNLVLVEVAP